MSNGCPALWKQYGKTIAVARSRRASSSEVQMRVYRRSIKFIRFVISAQPIKDGIETVTMDSLLLDHNTSKMVRSLGSCLFTTAEARSQVGAHFFE